MDILWLIGLFFGVNFLCGNSLARIAVLKIPQDSIGHGTQYRFQYFVKDQDGDYKTQEEAGGGGRARGSYAVEEPNGDTRIIQYTADIGGGFKAHIKVDHGDKSPSKSAEIDIKADEMQKLIENNRKKTFRNDSSDDIDDQLSKSYVLGPPKKISDVIMEQAAAIREIISKEIEAEKKREAEEKLKLMENVDTDETVESVSPGLETPKNIKEEIYVSKKAPEIQNGQNSSEGRTGKVRNIDEKNAQSTVVRVALSPRKIEDSEIEKNNDKVETIQSQILGEGPVRNLSFKNRLMMFYKPRTGINFTSHVHKIVPNDDEEHSNHPEMKPTNLSEKINNDEDKNNEKKEEEKEEVVLFSAYQDDGKQGERKNNFIKVPYEVLRPYLTETKGYANENNK